MFFLDNDTLSAGVEILVRRDADLRRAVERLGPPPLWAREPGFPTLIHIILEQQVSLRSAAVAFERLGAHMGRITPDAFLALSDDTLRQIGFSRQKTRYGRLLADAVVNGELDLSALSTLPDPDVSERLTRIKGIGPWTVNIYLLMALRRPDVWPIGDLALASAVRRIKGLDTTPVALTLERLGEPYRPYRSVAAHILWWYYLDGKLPE
ncbi:MAG: DNA-3-methyladenine glycosylase 2 family protein [candidate division Zixibacteria bacterium]|nr:DNA-3-methyladenine glycosylase 2 family protein [candidate division Zixibacteria bacterium]